MTTENPDPFALLIDDETDEFLPKVEKILKEIFDRFDKDKSSTWNDEELQNFAQATNGRPFDASVIQEIKDSFDLDSQKHLTIKGFYEMFHVQTLSDPEETLKDFKKHGYDNNLELVASRTKDVSLEEEPKTPLAKTE